MFYPEILELYKHCGKVGVEAKIEPFCDGYAICFVGGGDIVQHKHSVWHDSGYVEPKIGCEFDYCGLSLEEAKALVERFKDKLNTPRAT